MKKHLLLAVLMLLPLMASADVVEIDGIYYELSSGETPTATVTSGANKYSGDIDIPASVIYNNVRYSVTSIKGLTSLKINSRRSWSSKGNSAFQNCSGLTSVTIPNSVTSIGDGAFWGCSGLTSLTIGNSVNSIGMMAFANCSGLTSVSIPLSVTSIGVDAFLGCSGLTNINVDTWNMYYDSRENCNAIIETQSNTLILGCKNTIIPSSVTHIGGGAFFNCNGLTSVTIPNSVISIGDDAFSGCSGLTSVKIPKSVTSIGQLSFYSCNSLTSIEVEDGNANYDSRENCNAIIETQSNTLIYGCKNTIIPNGVTSIGNSAFYVSGLSSVTIPNSVTSIGNRAFWGCNLTTINIPNSVTSIGEMAFMYCKLTSVTIPNSVTSISNDVFAGCYKLASVTIPNSVTSIGSYAFDGCSLTSVTIPNSVTSIKSSAFCQCSNLISIVVEAGNTTYDSRDNCNAIIETATNTLVIGCKNTVIPNSVTSIGRSSFSECRSLTSITIPNSVTSIGSYAFASCSGLTSVTSLGVTPPSADANAFTYTSIENITLYVPSNSVDVYKATAPWSNFKEIKAIATSDYPIDILETPLTFEAVEGTVTVNIRNYFCNYTPAIQYSIDDGPWTDFSLNHTECHGEPLYYNYLPAGKVVRLRANEWRGGFWEGDRFEIDCGEDCYVYGNVMSLCKGENFATDYEKSENFGFLFRNNTHIKNHPTKDLILPSTTLTSGCYGGMFTGCTGITRAPKLPATTLTEKCYAGMFKGCSSLTEAPELSATKLERQCYTGMFMGCTNLKSVKCMANDNIAVGEFSIILDYFIISNEDNGTVTDWLKDAGTNVSGTKTFIVNDGLIISGSDPTTATVEKWGERSVSGIPSGWIIGNLIETAPITIGKSGKASYCGDKSLDFSFSDEVKAYIATGFDETDGTIWLTRVKDVPAGTPVLIKGAAEKTYQVPVTDSQNSYYKNMFKGNTSGETIQIQETEDGFVNYYLSGDGTFKSVKNYANIGNNKSYLQLPGTFKPAEVGTTQTVKVGSAGKASFAAPVDLDFTNVEGLKAFTATGYDKSSKTIWLSRVMKVQKGEGVLLKGDAKDYEIPSVAVQSSYMNMFVGNTSGAQTQVQETSEDGTLTNYYLKGDGTFVSVNNYVNIGNNKCYLALPTDMVATAATTRGEASYLLDEPEVIKLPISFRSLDSDGNGTTGVREVKSVEVKGEKWFTLQGQRVENPGKGLYIKNGKKVVIK